MSENYSIVLAEIASLAMTSPQKADNELMAFASKEGDEAAVELMADLPPAVLAIMMRVGDITVPAFTALLSDPEQAIKVMEVDPDTWRNLTTFYRGESHRPLSLSGVPDLNSLIVRDIGDIITSIILPRKNDAHWVADFCRLLKQSEKAMQYIAVPFIACGGPIPDESALDNEELTEEEDADFTTRWSFPYPYNEEGAIGEVYRVIAACDPELEQELFELIADTETPIHVLLQSLQEPEVGDEGDKMFEPFEE